MIWVTAIYKLPVIKHIFLIVASDDGRPNLSSRNCIQKEEFAGILRDKDREIDSPGSKWTTKLIHSDDFLSALEDQGNLRIDLSNPSFDSSEHMELLAINLQPQKSCPDPLSMFTPKVLSRVPDEDIIEVMV